MYGAMSLKYTSGAESLYQGISFLVYGDEDKLEEEFAGVYYVSLAIFVGLSIAFSFGDIENSKNLQIVSAALRVTTLICFYIGTCYYLIEDGVQKAEKTWDWAN
jgi:hypothetical protein